MGLLKGYEKLEKFMRESGQNPEPALFGMKFGVGRKKLASYADRVLESPVRATSPRRRANMIDETAAVSAPTAAKKAAAKKTTTKKVDTGHRNYLYEATAKLTVEKLKGQAALVAKALKAYTTPRDLTTIVDKVKSNGEYKVKGGVSAILDSVHYHLRRFVSTGEVKESQPAA